jgi:hypothetical protein
MAHLYFHGQSLIVPNIFIPFEMLSRATSLSKDSTISFGLRFRAFSLCRSLLNFPD